MRPHDRDHGLLAFFLADLSGGGAERAMSILAGGLSARGLRVDMILADAVGPYVGQLPVSVRVVDLAAGGVLRAIPRLARRLRDTRPDVLVTTLQHASLAAILARRLAGVPTEVVVREASTPSMKRRSYRRPKGYVASLLMQRAYRLADHVVAVSAGAADDLARYAGIPAERVTVLPNPVIEPNLARLRLLETKHPWLDDADVPVVLGVGRLHPDKDFATLLRAFAALRLRRPARLVLLGDGAERGALLELARGLGISDDIDLPGFVTNPYAFMARASVYVLASKREGLPGSLIQALACGCPVVATDCRSGPAEVLAGGRYGALVPVGDAESMAVAIEQALDEPLDQDVLREAAEPYTSEAATTQYVRFLETRTQLSARRSGATAWREE